VQGGLGREWGGAHRRSEGAMVAAGSWKSQKSFTRVSARMMASHENVTTWAYLTILQQC